MRRTSRAGSRTQRILGGLAALACLLLLIGGVPLVLLQAWHYLGSPIPSLQELASPDDGTLFVRVLCLIGWLSWATFVWSVLAEILAQWRGWRLPALGWQQRIAGGLVTAVMMLVNSPTIASAAAIPVRPAAVVTTIAAPAETASSATTTPARGYLEHTVQPGEQMPGLAERYLGDRYQWPAIAAATAGLPQPDGKVLRPGDTQIYPGWTVRIPTSAPARLSTVAFTTSQAPQHATPVYQVRDDDWLGSIAERYLGDFDRYPEIAALNPHLITDPDTIEPGWRLTLPAGATDHGARAHAAGHLLEQSRPAQGGEHGGPSGEPGGTTAPPHTSAPTTTAPSTPAPTNSAPSTTAPSMIAPSTAPTRTTAPSSAAAPRATAVSPTPTHSTPARATPTPAGSASPTRPPASEATPDSHQPAEDDSMLDHVLLIGTPLAGAGLLAALALTLLRRRRRRQEQHRPVGRRLPEPVRPQTETQLRTVAEPIAVDRLDHALRVLAAGLVDRPADKMPDIVGAWIDDTTINLLLTAPCADPPPPWKGDEHNWSLPGDVDLPDADGQLAPLPTLVAVGSQPGMHLLLDLERLGLLAITGDPQRAADLLRYLAVELSCNTWSDHVEVTIAGFDAEETGELIALGGDRLTAVPAVATAIERIRRRASQVVQSLEHLGAGDPLTGRIADIAADAWMPHVLLIKDPSPADIAALETLDNDLAATGRCAVAVVTTVAADVGRWPLTVAADQHLGVGFLGMAGPDATLTAAGIPRDELHHLADLLTTARRGVPGPADPQSGDPADAFPPVPAAPETEPWARGTDAAGALLPPRADHDHDDTDEDEQPDPTDDEAPPEVVDNPTPDQPTTASEPAEHQASAAAPPLVDGGDDITRVPAVVALPGRQAPVRKRPATAPRRRHNDPTLDADLRAWHDADPHRPRIAILGPVTVEAPGQLPAERLRFYAEIIVLLAVRGARGATTDQFDEALWPGQPVKATSRRVAVARARRWLGESPEGDAWLPDATGDRRYRLRDGYLLDWHLFRRLRARGEDRGPAGVGDLRQALSLVRGAPLAGADVAYSAAARNPYVWLPTSDIPPHHLAAAVVDTAHHMVDLCLDAADISSARWAVEQAWLADPDRAGDVAWRDLMRVAAAEGNTAELDQLLGELMRIREAEVPEDLDSETYRLLCELLPDRMRAGVR